MKRNLVLLSLCILITSSFSVSLFSRQISKVGQLFNDLNSGVVTLFSSTQHGTGFLIGKEGDIGLVLTNSHVVNGIKSDLRARFKHNEVVEAKFLTEDKVNDLAIVLINLQNIPDYKILKPFTPPEKEKLVVVGEQVFAIGSPINWQTLEKTLSSGIVGKFSEGIIRHDVNLNPGNS
ncbi:MAG TPA: serine protease, partial [Vampirovibrionales bacterium]